MKKTVSAILLLTLIMSATAFAATPEGHWFQSYEPQVIEAVPYAAMYSDAFNPDAYVTYLDFAQISAMAINKAIVYDGALQDENITRIDALKIICERLDYKNDLDEMQQVKAAASIADFNSMTAEQKEVAILAVSKGLVKGDENGNLNPDSFISYAELLIIFTRIK